MNLRSAFAQLKANILAGNATVLVSPPGMGKSELMLKVALWFLAYIKASNSQARIGMSTFFMATQNPIGFTGLPWKSEKTWTNPVNGQEVTCTVTDPAVPQWFMATCLETGEVLPATMFDHVFLVIEEWGQGSPETKRAGAEVLRAGGTPPWYLPNGSPRAACSNSDTRDGVTKEYDFIINRTNWIYVTGDVMVWHDDFADYPYQWQGRTWHVQPYTKHWAKKNPAILFEPKPEKQGQWCTPRSITMCDRYVQTATELNNGEIPLKDPTFKETINGYVGANAGVSYVTDLQFMLELPTYQQVVSDPMGTPVPNKADLMMLMAYQLAGHTQPGDLKAVLQYMDKRDASGHGMPRDMNITFVSSLLRRDYSLLNDPAMDAWIGKHAHLVGIIGKLSRSN